MANDEGIAQRIREVMVDKVGVTEKKMFGGIKGFVYVGDKGFESDADLEDWIELVCQFVMTLPAK